MVNVERTFFGLAVALGIVAIGCTSVGDNTSVVPDPNADIQSGGNIVHVNRIAYVNSNGDLFTVDPDGNGLSQLTGGFQVGPGTGGGSQAQPLRLNEYYAWPTWSADGTKLAASRVLVGEDKAEISVEVMDARSGRSETVYKN